MQVLGESFSPMKSKQLSYCKFWGAFKINGSDAIASFGGEFSPHQIPDLKSYCKFLGKIFTPSNSWFKKLLQVLGENFLPMKSKQLSYCKIWGAFKINGSDAIASFGGEFSPHQIPDLKSYCKFLGELLQDLGSQ